MKKSTVKSSPRTISMGLAAGVVVALWLAFPTFAGSKPSPGQSSAFGKALGQWEDLYVRWEYGNLAILPDRNGNAVVNHVVLMPIPATPGDGTPGHLDVTMSPGQPFVLPLQQLLGTSYTDGTPDDPFVDVSWFQTMDITLQVDGVTVINTSNVMDYYSQFSFSPPVPLPPDFAPLDSIIWCQAIGFVHTPLSVGTHTIKLDERNTEPLPPGFGGGFVEFHNTWTVTVQP